MNLVNFKTEEVNPWAMEVSGIPEPHGFQAVNSSPTGTILVGFMSPSTQWLRCMGNSLPSCDNVSEWMLLEKGGVVDAQV